MLTSESLRAPMLVGAPELEGREEEIEIPIGWSRIGRSPMAEIRLNDPGVSRRHAVLVRSDDGCLRILDDRSITGTYLNGERVRWAELSDGDELTIGGFTLVVRQQAADSSAAA